MHFAVLIDDRVAVRGEGSTERAGLVQRFAVLLERDDAQFVRAGDGACIRLECSGDELEQRALSASVRTQQSDRWPGPSSRSRFLTIGRPPSDLQSCVASTNCLDLRPDAVKLMPAVPWSFRASALFSSSIKRPAESIRDLAFVVRALGPRRSHSTSRRTRLANDAS